MWFFKKKPIEIPETPKQVKCAECKHWIDKEDAQFVEHFTMRRYEITHDKFSYFQENAEIYCYCQMHRRKFGRVRHYPDTVKYFRNQPQEWIECDEDGNIKK